jgi:hypothetical protein
MRMGHELGIPRISSNTVEFYKERPSGLSMKIFTHIWSISIPKGLLGLPEVAFAELQRAEETHWSPLHLLGSLGPNPQWKSQWKPQWKPTKWGHGQPQPSTGKPGLP